MVASAPSAGAETRTRLAPAVRCAEALSFEVKMPVHSIAMSMPRSFQGSFEGSRSAVTLILLPPRLIVSPSTVTVPGKRPWTLSKRSRWALVSTGPRSLMPTTSISLRPDSATARKILRPMRPNPLIPTRIAMLVSPSIAGAGPAETFHEGLTAERPVRPGGNGQDGSLGRPFFRQSQPSAQAFQGSVNGGLGGNSKVLEKVLGGGAGTETGHAYEFTILTDHGIPAPAHCGLDRDLDRRIADNGVPPVRRLRQQQFERGHRDPPRRDAAFRQLLLGGHRDLDLGARGEQRHLGLALRRDQLIGAMRARIIARRIGAQLRQVLAGQRQHRRAIHTIERQFPALRDLDGVAGPEHAHVGNGAERGEMFDRLMRRAVFAEPD